MGNAVDQMLRTPAGATVLWVVVPLAALTPPALAHPAIEVQVAALTKQIELDPGNATLYLRRGELHRVHRDWDTAMADYERAHSLDPELDIVHLSRGRMLLEAGWPKAAKVALDRFVSRRPDHVTARVTRARVLAKLGRYRAAAADFTRAIALIQSPHKPIPEYYLERARALAAAGPAHLDQALRGLDEGVERLGPLVTLQLYAIELELKAKRYDAALARLDRIAAGAARKERWLARRGEILAHAGRHAEARAAWVQARTAIAALPPRRRGTRAVAELENRIRMALAHSPDETDTARKGKQE